jgi:hypothetical protein
MPLLMQEPSLCVKTVPQEQGLKAFLTLRLLKVRFDQSFGGGILRLVVNSLSISNNTHEF